MIGLASDHVTFWWITLGLGLVVASAVIVLLQLLVSFVKDIEVSVVAAAEEMKNVTGQTESTELLNDTAALAEALRGETRAHADAFVAAVNGDRR